MANSARRSTGPDGEQIISLATLAVGGQGGGVLSNWIIAVAEANSYLAQSTSVAGVAQRTGATIYYIEMCKDTGKQPVFTLSPAEKDVDILIAAELMEAGRAVMRGFTSPEFTTLIASTHRISAISEKIAPGDGRIEESEVFDAMRNGADTLIAFDMEDIAKSSGTIISSSLLGALAGSGALPFPRESYEAVVATGRGAKASLKAFGIAYDEAKKGTVTLERPDTPAPVIKGAEVPTKYQARWDALRSKLAALPEGASEMAQLGLQKVIEYQDVAYGEDYLTHLSKFQALDAGDGELTQTAAKYVAKAMCYDDVIRVADIKTRPYRMDRVKSEISLKEDQVLHLTEYFHPRFEEFYLCMPKRLGTWLSKRTSLERFYERHLDKGRRIRTDSLRGFLTLWLVSALRPMRRKLLRHSIETAHMEEWLALCLKTAQTDVPLAIELLKVHRLIKGYSDTHVRGQSKFDRVIGALPMLQGRPDAAEWIGRLRNAALDDVEGKQLDGAIQTVASFAE